jgi:hypothetical protein
LYLAFPGDIRRSESLPFNLQGKRSENLPLSRNCDGHEWPVHGRTLKRPSEATVRESGWEGTPVALSQETLG